MLPLSYDTKYNIIICLDCCIGLPFDWIEGHLRDNHGIRTTMDEILRQINEANQAIKSFEVVRWIENHTTISIAMKGIPVLKGFRCSICTYCTPKKQSMTEHLSKNHRNQRGKGIEANIQRPFGGWFKKYIQVEEVKESDFVEQEAWKDELNDRFDKSLKIDNSKGDSQSLDMRLMNAFIAKAR
jgi:hypothetical protein